ncbi:hypothetical protein [Jannaschia aquimarina]|uniref:Uncharacterized protein n=1 Tax=Jannaschia aquimarina TaxID=935700 RepID=A0A0D1CJS4_9RHOB|nr:hypothetical protein [Jannaschia aquimarina]KIT14982.1 hypothetical protein jaqu_33070 [Jannaschia aquimarina]SNS61147.1 hypothetical protein SAMN05421775_101632 [Jannaschia aquimarina]
MLHHAQADLSSEYASLAEVQGVTRVLSIGEDASAISPKIAACHALSGLGMRRAVVSGRDGRVILCLRTGLVVEGDDRLNAGLLAVRLRALPEAVNAIPAGPAPVWTDAVHHTLWALAQRLYAVELPRLLSVLTGSERLKLRADRDGVRLVAGATDPTDIAPLITSAIGAGRDVVYTLAAPEDTIGPQVPAPVLLGCEDGLWRLDRSGWPLACPKDAAFAEIAAMVGFSRALRALGAGRATLHAEPGAPPISMTMNEKGSVVAGA